MRSCADVRPIWSADVDPCVLRARVVPDALRVRVIAGFPRDTRQVIDESGTHLLVEVGREPVRLDIVNGTIGDGPFLLCFDLPDDASLDAKVAAIRSLRAGTPLGAHHLQLARRLAALHAVDARGMGASLREIGEFVLGAGDWPGDGECRKSRVRRMLDAGLQMVRAGPRAILSSR